MAKLDALFKYLRDHDASDLYLVVGEPPKMRQYGSIANMEGAPRLTIENIKSLMFEILSEEQRSNFERDRDLDFAHSVPGVARLRCNYFYQNFGPAAVFRLIPERIIPLAELHLPSVIGSFADYARGLILVTGPSGCGKSTTLAAIINEMNERYSRHIITIEDPLEFVHSPKKAMITHREVRRHCESFGSALTAAVRQDPDVILVGEMRDLDTVSQALTAAEMGFLVLGTLATNSAAKTVDRVVDIFPASQQPAVRTMLAGSLIAITSQLLVKGADHKSRLCACEIMITNTGMSNAIREGNLNMLKSGIQSGASQGMVLMDTALEKLVQSGKADPEDVYLKSGDKQRFGRYLPNKPELK